MRVKISNSKVSGTVQIPPSKSMSHRAIVLASLAKGTSKISNLIFSDDIIATIEAMNSLGAKIEKQGNDITVTGIENFNLNKKLTLNCNESGSTLRFLIPLASLFDQEVKFTGQGKLLERPQTVYNDIFKKQNKYFQHNKDSIVIKEKLSAGTFKIDGSISSQFITGLLLTLPFLKEDSTIEITEPFESSSYVTLTINLMKLFSLKVEQIDPLTFKIKGNQQPLATDYCVEGDFSQLAFHAVLGAINNDLTLTGIDHSSNQGDKVIIDILKKAGCKIAEIENGYKIYKSDLKAQLIDLADCPDLGPILTVLAACSEGTTEFINAERLRIKESDRILAMETNLKKYGIDFSSTASTMTITGGILKQSAVVDSFNDHRIAMSLTVLGTILDGETIIEDANAITKSYPNFYQVIKNIKGRVETID